MHSLTLLRLNIPSILYPPYKICPYSPTRLIVLTISKPQDCNLRKTPVTVSTSENYTRSATRNHGHRPFLFDRATTYLPSLLILPPCPIPPTYRTRTRRLIYFSTKTSNTTQPPGHKPVFLDRPITPRRHLPSSHRRQYLRQPSFIPPRRAERATHRRYLAGRAGCSSDGKPAA